MRWLTTVMEDPDAFASVTARIKTESSACRLDPRNPAFVYVSFATRELVWNDAALAMLDVMLELKDVELLATPPTMNQFVRLTP